MWVTLLVPIALTWIAVWLVWHQKRRYLGLVTFCLCAYSLAAGFSIGAAYLPAAVVLLCASLADKLRRPDVSAADDFDDLIARLGHQVECYAGIRRVESRHMLRFPAKEP